MKLFFIFFFVSLVIQFSSCYRMDIEEKNDAQYCEYRKHYTLKPTATCCSEKVIVPGINLNAHWAECGNQIKKKSNTLERIGWDMYGCILKMSSGGKEEFTLQEFSDLVTTQYPDDIKTKINEEVQKQSIPTASLTNIKNLEKIRATYYDIEKAVCEGTVGDGLSYGMTEMCSSWKEENHRGGMCCNKAYPVDIRLYSNMEPEIATKKMVSGLCRNYKLHPRLMALNGSETENMEHNIMGICDFACQMHGSDEIKIEDDIINRVAYWDFNLDVELERHFLPSFVHDDIVQDAKQYVQSVYSFENTVNAMKEYQFEDVMSNQAITDSSHNLISYDKFPPLPEDSNVTTHSPPDYFDLEYINNRKFDEKIIHIPILCSAYHEISTLMEHAMFRNCHPVEVSQGESQPEPEPTPAPEPEPEPESVTPAEETES